MSITRRNIRNQQIAHDKAAETLKKYSIHAGIESLGFVHAVSEEKAIKTARRKFGHENTFAVLKFKVKLV